MTKAEGPMWRPQRLPPRPAERLGSTHSGHRRCRRRTTGWHGLRQPADLGWTAQADRSRSLFVSLAPIHLGPRLSLTAFSGAHHAADA